MKSAGIWLEMRWPWRRLAAAPGPFRYSVVHVLQFSAGPRLVPGFGRRGRVGLEDLVELLLVIVRNGIEAAETPQAQHLAADGHLGSVLQRLLEALQGGIVKGTRVIGDHRGGEPFRFLH